MEYEALTHREKEYFLVPGDKVILRDDFGFNGSIFVPEREYVIKKIDHRLDNSIMKLENYTSALGLGWIKFSKGLEEKLRTRFTQKMETRAEEGLVPDEISEWEDYKTFTKKYKQFEGNQYNSPRGTFGDPVKFSEEFIESHNSHEQIIEHRHKTIITDPNRHLIRDSFIGGLLDINKTFETIGADNILFPRHYAEVLTNRRK